MLGTKPKTHSHTLSGSVLKQMSWFSEEVTAVLSVQKLVEGHLSVVAIAASVAQLTQLRFDTLTHLSLKQAQK